MRMSVVSIVATRAAPSMANAFATAVGCAVMQEIAKPGFLTSVEMMGGYLANRLEELSREHQCGEVRGRAFFLRLILVAQSDRTSSPRSCIVVCCSTLRIQIRYASCPRPL